MDTSDSECFESADEGLDSGGESRRATSRKPSEAVASVSRLSITETGKDETKPAAKPAKAEKKGRPKNTLGMKLGTRLSKPVSGDADLEKTDNMKVESTAKTTASNTLNDLEIDTNSPPAGTVENPALNLQEEEVNMWADDEDWEPAVNTSKSDEKAPETVSKEDEDKSWSGWGNWGVSSLLSTATMSMSTITNHVSQGLTTVLESGIGVPDPEELAKLNKAVVETESTDEESLDKNSTADLTFGLGSLMSGVSQITRLVETTGSRVISGGLDTLETIGKKTMEVLQEGDPGLKKKRAFLKMDADKPVLSQVLREAKEKAEAENKLREERHFARKANYETLFDDHQGLAHLEALEMLSRQCSIKLQTLLETQSGAELVEMQETLEQVKELCELADEEEEEGLSLNEIEAKLDTIINDMNVPMSYSKLVSAWADADHWLDTINLVVCSERELHEESINILAQLTATSVELFHKTGELLLIKDHRSTVDEADSLVQLTTTLTILIGNVAKKISDKLNEKAAKGVNKDDINKLITNVYYEATNSSTYIKNAFQLLIPVLQVGAV